MRLVEAACVAIIVAWVAIRGRRDPGPARLLARLALLAAASWIGEESCIHAYRFYRYSPLWSLFLDEVPLLVPLIWPLVIHSAWDLARALLPAERRGLVPLLGGVLVLADASLIEPIAVQAGLWSWSEAGLFAVPPIGILGWGFFAAACMACLERAAAPIALVAAPLATHGLLLLAWWGALRWVSGPIAPWPVAAVAWLAALPLAAVAWRQGLRRRVVATDLLARIPPALLFFFLLAARGHDVAPLVAYALAFAPPWLAITPAPSRPPKAPPANG